MGPEQPRHVCHACIGDKVLAQQVEEAGTHAKCSYCHVAGNTTTLTELAEWIHQVLEEHFERIPILLENQNDEPDATDDISEQLRNLLDDTETVIERVANLDPKPKPRWDVHVRGVESWSGSPAAGRWPLIARRCGSGVLPPLSGWPDQRGSCRPAPAP